MAETTNAFDAHIAQAVGSDGEYLAGSDTLASILIPDGSQETVTRCIDAVLTTCHERYGREAVSLGIASWPCLDFIKSDIPGNCLKALYHGSFLGPGSVVYFDHLSLNISGDYFFDEGDYQSALREYHRGLRQQPGDINLMNSLGVALVEHGQERRAAACFQDVLRQDAENYMALVNLGRVCQTLGKKEDAVRCFERAYRKHGQDDACGQELFLPLGRLYTEFGYPEKAIAIFEHWRTRPGSESEFLLFRLLGQSYMENQQPEEAIKACQRALRLFPHDSISMSTLGLLYVEQGEGSDVGLSLCNKALSLDNFNPDHWYRLSRALLCIGKRAEALEAGKQCLHLQRTHVEGTAQMGQVHKALGRDKLAKRYYMQALALKQCTQLHAKRIRRSLDELSRGCVQESDISSCGDRAKKAASQRGRRKK
jgi:tetratricopeptide (TPR) repeat protein